MEEQKGLILIFDLDQTLVATNKQFSRRFTRKKGQGTKAGLSSSLGRMQQVWNLRKSPELNPELVEVLKHAVEQKATGGVYAIFLLTNNSYRSFINRVIRKLERVVGTKHLFDAQLTAEDNEPRDTPKGYTKYYSSKSLRDVYRLLDKMEGTTDSHKRYHKEKLMKRILFFDDNPDHVLHRELWKAGAKGNYITIDPPFMGVDETPYGKVMERLNSAVPHIFPFLSVFQQPVIKHIARFFQTRKKSKRDE